MAHELSIIEDTVEMFFVKDLPWHGLGQCVEDAPDSHQAIQAAHLGWKVRKYPMWWGSKPTEESLVESDHYTTVREDTMDALGTVGPDYAILQNEDAFGFMDELLGEGVKYETAGALSQGKRVWLLARLPEMMNVTEEDKVGKYLCLFNSHDGSSSIRVFFTPVRVVCSNTLTVAMSKAEYKVNIRHIGDIKKRVEMAQMVLGTSIKKFDKLEGVYKRMVGVKLTNAEAVQGFSAIYPGKTKRTENIVKTLMELYRRCLVVGTLWSWFNAVTAYADHMRKSKAESRMNSAFWGNGLDLKTKAYNMALKKMGGGE